MHALFFQYLETYRLFAYAVIFIGLLLEGEVTLFLAALLVHQGFLNLYDTLALTLLGVFLGDLLWFTLGEHLSLYKKISAWVEREAGRFDHIFQAHTFKSLLVTRFLYGLSRPTLIRMGMLRIPIKKFLEANIVTTLVWSSLVWIIAYALSASILSTRHFIPRLEAGIALIIIAIIVLNKLARRFIEKGLLE
ncbi:VTT domain-containing protein [Candidatus Campbellbacteria bacterium]|nr:MAG: VTT domain-containing protein [Candidatus Campbellbacteria bacterium]